MGPIWFRAAGERFAGLELLFDLVFVFSVSQLTRLIREDPSWRTGLVVALLFVPVWWSWSGVTFAMDRFPADDGVSRFLVIGAAAGSAAMALAVPSVPGAGEVAFACGYAAVRFALVAYYLRVRRTEPDGGALARFYAVGFAVVGGLWLFSLPLPTPLRPVLWGPAVVLDVALPQLAARRRILLPVDGPHLADRCAAFVIIVIGEALVETLGLASEGRFSWTTAVTTAAAAALSIAFWWGFFDRGSWRRRYQGLGGDRSGQIAATVVSYLHLPLVMGIAAGAAGVQIAVLHPGRAIGTAAAVAIAVGCVLYLFALNSMTWVLGVAPSESLACTRFAIIAGIGVLTVIGRGWPSTIWITLVVCLLSVHGAAAGARSRRDRAVDGEGRSPAG